MPDFRGYPIVFTADRTLLADYDILFDGMLAASQTTTTPKILMDGLLMQPVRHVNGRAQAAPLGLRRIEAALLEAGFTPDDVVIADGNHLSEVVGSATRVIAVSSGDPLGLGMNSSTMEAVAGGTGYPEVMFRRLMKQVRAVAGRETKVIVGGPGAWQLVAHTDKWHRMGIDHVVTGYTEGNAAETFRALLAGEKLPAIITGQGGPAERIPRLRGATVMGVVEISRGCGLGCGFCTIAREPMQHLPVEHIATDVAINVTMGQRAISLMSEDFFRYGGNGSRANPAALLALLERLRRIDGLGMLQIDHVNLCSVAQFSDAELCQAHDLLVGDVRQAFPWVNVGVESSSGELVKLNGGAAKLGGRKPEEWGDFCAEQVRRLCRAGFFPLVSLMIGLPGETAEHLWQTLDWVEQMEAERLAVFPMIYAPIVNGAAQPPELDKTQWQLMRASYRSNFRWVPKLFWDNQACAGVPAGRRMILQALGWGKIAQWTTLFAWHHRRARDDRG